MERQLIIIEDNIPLSHAFKEIVEQDPDHCVLQVFHTAEAALERLDDLRPDVILMDIDLPGINGVEATREIKLKCPDAEVIMITVFENSKMVFDALCAGAIGYLTKNISPEQLLNSLNELKNGGAPMSVNIAKMVVESFQRPTLQNNPLSEREREVLSLLAEGNSYKDIGDTLYISKNTIKFHIKNIYIKLQVHTKTEAINKANQHRFI